VCLYVPESLEVLLGEEPAGLPDVGQKVGGQAAVVQVRPALHPTLHSQSLTKNVNRVTTCSRIQRSRA